MILGQILLQNHSITPEHLAISLWIQQKWGGSLGRILLSRGYVKEKDLLSALSYQLKIPAIYLENKQIPETIIRTLSHHLCEQYLILPFSKEPETGIFLIAMSDPKDESALSVIQQSFKNYRVYIAGFIDLTSCMWKNFQNISTTRSFFASQIMDFEKHYLNKNSLETPPVVQIEEVDDADIITELPVGRFIEKEITERQNNPSSIDYELLESSKIQNSYNLALSDNNLIEIEEEISIENDDDIELMQSSDFEIIEEKPSENSIQQNNSFPISNKPLSSENENNEQNHDSESNAIKNQVLTAQKEETSKNNSTRQESNSTITSQKIIEKQQKVSKDKQTTKKPNFPPKSPEKIS